MHCPYDIHEGYWGNGIGSPYPDSVSQRDSGRRLESTFLLATLKVPRGSADRLLSSLIEKAEIEKHVPQLAEKSTCITKGGDWGTLKADWTKVRELAIFSRLTI